MKRLLFTCLLLVAAWTLFAQTGLFGLYYGESYGAVKDSLENYEPAFDCIEEEGTRSVYVSYDNEYVDQIVCYFPGRFFTSNSPKRISGISPMMQLTIGMMKAITTTTLKYIAGN